jgi:hypothetical protein
MQQGQAPPPVVAAPPPVIVAPQAPALPVAAFALTPALANNAAIDYTTSTGMKLYTQAIAPLAMKFDGEPKNLAMFLHELSTRAIVANWGEIISQIPDANGTPRNLIKDYGILSIQNIQAHALTYIAAGNRNAQNNMQMYLCLTTSLTDEAKKKIAHEVPNYQLGPDETISAACFLKVIIESARVATNATTAFIRTNLSHLETYMTTVDSNIIDFNNYVKAQVSDLGACGQTSNDLLINLFSGYSAAADAIFVQYIAKKRDLYDEGQEITAVQLMTFAENKYKSMKQANIWRATTKEEEQFIALSAQIDTLKATNQALLKKRKSEKPYDRKGFPPARGNNKEGNKKKWAKNNKKGDKKKTDKDCEWKKIPIPGQTTLRRDGKLYNWCINHKAWTLHSTATCKGVAAGWQGVNNNQQQQNQEDNLELAKAYATRIKQEHNDYYDDE